MSDQESEYSLNGLDLQIRYDESADVLYISFGDPRPGIAVEADSGDLVRVDPYSDQPFRIGTVRGATVIYSIGPDGKDDRALVEWNLDRKQPGDFIFRLELRPH